jgi:SAM-dependent methyltransferase
MPISGDLIWNRASWWHARARSMLFDAVHGVDTGYKLPAELEITSANRDKGFAYDPCPWPALRQTLRLASLQATDFAFVDIGCGKGKVVLAAMIMPFLRVVGVEYSAYLCRVATQNVRSARLLTRCCPRVEIICADATRYPIPEDPTIFFFANPFGSDIMECVLDNIAASYEHKPRQLVMIFYRVSALMPQVSHFLSTRGARWTVSTTLARRSVNIFELGSPSEVRSPIEGNTASGSAPANVIRSLPNLD